MRDLLAQMMRLYGALALGAAVVVVSAVSLENNLGVLLGVFVLAAYAWVRWAAFNLRQPPREDSEE